MTSEQVEEMIGDMRELTVAVKAFRTKWGAMVLNETPESMAAKISPDKREEYEKVAEDLNAAMFE